MTALSQTRFGQLLRDVHVTTRDGVRLEATVYLPPGDGPWPVVLVRTAYNRSHYFDASLLARGLALVVQDTRGRYGSGGTHYPFITEAADGEDTLDWLVQQPWCNGHVGMYGDSYLAATQFYLAPRRHKALKAINPRFMSGDLYRQAYYCGGALSVALTMSWLCFEMSSPVSNAPLLEHFPQEDLIRHLPIIEMDQHTGHAPINFYRDYVTHERYDDFWKALNVRDQMHAFDMPVLLTGGWYDYYANETFANYNALLASAATPELARGHRVIVGPWTHGISGSSRLGQLDFGPHATCENDHTHRWLDTLLHGRDAADFQQAPIRLFVMGLNQWRDEHEWPLARTRWQNWHLHSRGSANSLLGNGSLSPEPPGDQPVDQYTYNPDHPMPTLGGNHSVGPYNPGLYELCRPGPYDQRPNERRDDMLVYTSDVLTDDLELTGPVVVHLFASSTAPDTDFVARLCDVHPDGRSINLTEGVLRARYHESFEQPTLLEPGQVYRFTIHLQPTSHVLFKGHQLRLDITSSNFPLWDRNLNTGEHPATSTRMQLAHQTIYHTSRFASHVVLPVIPRG